MNKTQFTFCEVEDIRYCPASGKLYRQAYEIPDKFEPLKIVEKREHKFKRPDLVGKTSGMSRLQYLAVLLLKNEINACNGQAVVQDTIYRRLRKEFPLWDKKASLNFLREFSKYRNKYNQGTLHAEQPTPLLFSFHYNENGYICHKIRKKDMLSFPFIRGELQARKFADPRFFTPEEMQTFRDRAEANPDKYAHWVIPLAAEVRFLEKELGKPLYNSVTFADGYGENSKIF